MMHCGMLIDMPYHNFCYLVLILASFQGPGCKKNTLQEASRYYTMFYVDNIRAFIACHYTTLTEGL